MRTLRVRLDAPAESGRAARWALFDADGRRLAEGTDPATHWPPAEQLEAVLAADVARVVALALPPLPADRVASAATYALEDRLASPIDEAVVAVGNRREDGQVAAVVVQRALAAALARAEPRFDRAIAESQLVPKSDGWVWCDCGSGSFVRTEDGSAFAAWSASDESLPAELETALRQSARAGRAPERVVVRRAAAADADRLAAWTRAGGVPFVAGPPWDWTSAPEPAFDAAIDVLAPARAGSAPREPRASPKFAYAIALVAAAIGLHLIATAGTWAWRKVELRQERRAIEAIAQELGGASVEDISRLHAEARHRAGLAAPNDLLPLLARVAPALSALPAGALRSVNFRAGVVTVDMTPVDDTALVAMRDRLNVAGLEVVHARTPGGVRARIAAPQ